MDTERLSKWADLLLDTGKRNNLINFKDSKQGTVEIVAPDFNTLFEKAVHSVVFEVYDPKLDNDEDELDTDEDSEQQERQSKQSYLTTYAGRLKRNQILAYNVANKPIQALKSIGRKARTAIEETGVNIAYIAFGFIHWTESDDSQIEMRAPILLAPIAIENQSAVEPYYVRVSKYQKGIKEFNEQQLKIKSLLGKAYIGVNTDFEKLISELDRLTTAISGFTEITQLAHMPLEIFLSQKMQFKQIAESYSRLLEANKEQLNHLLGSFDADEYNVLSVSCIALIEKLDACLANTDKLDNWCDFIKLMTKLQESGLRSYIDFAIQQNIDSRKIVLTYKKAFYSQWVDTVLHESPILIELARVPHDEMIERFKEKDTLNFEINKAKIKAKLSAQRPRLDMVAQGSAIAILLREGEKKRKKKGIRQLLSELGDLAQTLKPCFLMSPLSVSTFLNSEMKFDVVVFDEASQIFPQDANVNIYIY